MCSEVVIAARGAGKCYRIFRRPEDRLKQMLSFGRRTYYSEYWALQDIDLQIRRGETVGIVGRNGAGKSTLLQLICGTLQPSRGTVAVTGRVAALLELGAGFNPEFTGRENVHLAASVLGLTQAQIDERYTDITDFAGIGDFIDQPVKLYSSGMYARLAFAVAAHVDADILIVDEILAVGDAAFTQKCMRFIHRFRQTGTLLFVSHDVSSITALCDRAIWLDRGAVRAEGPAKEIVHDYTASLFSEGEASSGFQIGGSRRQAPVREGDVVADRRHALLQETTARNSIELFDFDPEAPWFGARGATIDTVRLLAPAGQPLPALTGGEEVVLEISAEAHAPLHSPIIGFFVKNRLGLHLFGDNTYLSYRQAPVAVPAGGRVTARFRFQMPYLPSGDFSILVAMADGTQASHVQHHWIDDALFFHVQTSHVVKGLVGLPMVDIALQADLEVVR
ncbi:ABC transporter ATP-binding protein [Oleisolibacter albus]|uniref:ABC transporter ATP-binding protein n=1 Tax=Oleisolibacter albus TaxID=2171757 RepID=UPI000DF3AE2E|nr:ABC transporter ATP-binding protein [Oleisolibacter albus]